MFSIAVTVASSVSLHAVVLRMAGAEMPHVLQVSDVIGDASLRSYERRMLYLPTHSCSYSHMRLQSW